MKVINAEGIVFGLCSEEVQRDLEIAKNGGGKLYLFTDEKGWCLYRTEHHLYNCNSYKAEIPEPEYEPHNMESFLKEGYRFISYKFHTIYHAVIDVNEEGVKVASNRILWHELKTHWRDIDENPVARRVYK